MGLREDWLQCWGFVDGTPEASKAWAEKVEQMNGKRGQAPMAFVQRDICYDSPIDGRPITNKFARLEDLKRNNCIEYDPGMKQDAARRREESDRKLDSSVEQSVERAYEAMPTKQREKLAAELKSGATAEIERRSNG